MYGQCSDVPEDKKCCIEEIWSKDRWPRPYQCSKKRGCGPNGEYCKIHDPAMVEKREKERMAKYEEQSKQQHRHWLAANIGYLMIKHGFDTLEKVKALLKTLGLNTLISGETSTEE